MKYYITANPNSKHGYDLIVDNDGETQVIELTRKTTDNYLHIPEQCASETNRRLVSIAMIQKADVDMFEVTPREYREPRKLSTSNNVSRKGLEEYLNEEDKALFLALVEKAKTAREEATKKVPLTPIEKAQRKLAQAQAQLEKLLNA